VNGLSSAAATCSRVCHSLGAGVRHDAQGVASAVIWAVRLTTAVLGS
jgi:hypothetical protein